MKKVLILIISFFISVVLHFLIYDFIDTKVKLDYKLKVNTTDKITPIGYQQIKYVRLVKPKKQKVIKKIKQNKRKIRQKREARKKDSKVKKKIKLIKKNSIKIQKKIQTKKPKLDLDKNIYQTPKIIKNNINELLKIEPEESLIDKKIKDIKIIQKLDKQTQNYIKLYGDEYFDFSKEVKKYLNNNLSDIGRITQMYLTYPRIAVRTKQQGMNIIEFYLYPNGDINDLKIIETSTHSSLDKNTIKTIKLAYKDYPRPPKKTKIKIYVYYSLR